MDVALHSHALLAIKRIKEQQDVIIQLNNRINQLEQNHISQEKTIAMSAIEFTAFKGQMLTELNAIKNSIRK